MVVAEPLEPAAIDNAIDVCRRLRSEVHSYVRRTISYTGTHDNDTSVGWYREHRGGTRSPAQTERERRAAREYLNSDGEEIHWDMIRAVHASVAEQAIVPMQDLLGLGSEARMNRPGTSRGNWEWRLRPGQASARIARDSVKAY